MEVDVEINSVPLAVCRQRTNNHSNLKLGLWCGALPASPQLARQPRAAHRSVSLTKRPGWAAKYGVASSPARQEPRRERGLIASADPAQPFWMALRSSPVRARAFS